MHSNSSHHVITNNLCNCSMISMVRVIGLDFGIISGNFWKYSDVGITCWTLTSKSWQIWSILAPNNPTSNSPLKHDVRPETNYGPIKGIVTKAIIQHFGQRRKKKDVNEKIHFSQMETRDMMHMKNIRETKKRQKKTKKQTPSPRRH